MMATQMTTSQRPAVAGARMSTRHAALATPRAAPTAARLSSVASLTGTAALRAARPAAATPRRATAAAASPRAEISYIMIKPDGVQRGLVGDIISRLERKGFTLRALKLFQTPRDLAEEHYKDLSAKPFFKDLVDYIVSGPVVCMVWEGNGVVKSARKLIGATNPLEAEPGTIRGDFAIQTGRNVVHGSDS